MQRNLQIPRKLFKFTVQKHINIQNARSTTCERHKWPKVYERWRSWMPWGLLARMEFLSKPIGVLPKMTSITHTVVSLVPVCLELTNTLFWLPHLKKYLTSYLLPRICFTFTTVLEIFLILLCFAARPTTWKKSSALTTMHVILHYFQVQKMSVRESTCSFSE